MKHAQDIGLPEAPAAEVPAAGTATRGMPGLDAAGLIATWEAAAGLPVPLRALRLLDAAWPGQDWARTPIGQRDRQLFTLREALFGPAMEACADCPACGATLDLPLDTTELLAGSAPAAEAPLLVEAAGHILRCRLPDTTDLLAVAEAPEAGRGALLLARCTLSAMRGDAPCAVEALPPEVVAAAAAGMAAADPLADPRLGLHCPECGHSWTAPFDIAAFLWDDVEDLAQRLLRQIHILAGAYSWSEAEILRLSARRRRWYVEAVAGAP